MATTTRARKAPAKKPTGAAKPEELLAILEWLETSVLVERGPELRVLLLGGLARVNNHLEGRPGLAKSLSLREFTKCIVNANYYEKTLQPTTPADAVVGAYDMAAFARGEGLNRSVVGRLPWAHIGMLDELPRSNGPLRDALLPLLNVGERMYDHNGGMAPANLTWCVTAANTQLDTERDQALKDRITLFDTVADIRSDESFEELIRRDHERRTGTSVERARPTVTWEAFHAAQLEVAQIAPSQEFLEKASKLRRDAREAGLHVSPRRWLELFRVCRVPAWLSGRTIMVPDDLVASEKGLAHSEDQMPQAAQLVSEFQSRFVREAAKYRAEAAEPMAKWEQVRPRVDSTPPTQSIEPDTMREAVTVGRVIDAVKERVDTVVAEAAKEQRDAPELRELANELLAIQQWYVGAGLPSALANNRT